MQTKRQAIFTNTSVENTQKGDERSSFRFGYAPTPLYTSLRSTSQENNPKVRKDNPLVLTPSDPRIQMEVRKNDIPFNITQSILNYKQGNNTWEEELQNQGATQSIAQSGQEILSHSPNSTFLLRKQGQAPTPEKMDTNQSTTDTTPFVIPKKFSANFEQVIRKKSKNRYQVLTEVSELEIDDEIGRIVKRKREAAKRGPKIIDNNTTTNSKNNDVTTEPTTSTQNKNST